MKKGEIFQLWLFFKTMHIIVPLNLKTMRGHHRKFVPEAYQHIYQFAENHCLLFYSIEDRLFFLTVFSVTAQRYEVLVIAIALMFTHFHCLISVDCSPVMSKFIGTLTSIYAKAFNKDSGRKGKLFNKAFGNAVKMKAKKVRTCIAYNFNNPVEKGLCGKAEEDRWNLLAYLNSDHPFSEPIVLSKASVRLRNALHEVDHFRKNNHYLGYHVLRRLFKKLSAKEKEQLTDYIINSYNPIDKQLLLSYYKNYDDMLIAINSNTGSEYDIRERYDPDSDQAYVQMLELISHSSFKVNPHSITAATIQKKMEIAQVFRQGTQAKQYQIDAVLHLKHDT